MLRHNPIDVYNMRKDTILFKASTQEGRIKGLTIVTGEPAKPTFSLRIDDRRTQTQGRVVILPDENNPAGISLLK